MKLELPIHAAPPAAPFWRVMRWLGIALFLLVAGGPAVIAENTTGPSSTFFLQERQSLPLQRLRQQRPSTSYTKAVRRASPPVWREPVRYAAPPGPYTPALPVLAPSFFIAVLGDSLGVLMAQGLQEAYAERPEIAVLKKAKESSGLVRDDFYDWPKAVSDMLAKPEHIDIAILLIGSNDRQEMPDKTSPLAFRAPDGVAISPDWQAAYARRVEAISAEFRDRHIPLVWVGLPVMKNDKMSAELGQLNEIYRQRASKAGAVYIDIWEAFVNDAGKFDTFGPDLNGEIVTLRTADGIHFTKAGARKLAHFVEAEIKRVLDTAKPPAGPLLAALPGPAAAAPAEPASAVPAPGPAPVLEPEEMDINAVLRRQFGTPEPVVPQPGGNDVLASLPLPAEPAAPYFPQRPLAGPVTMLTALPLAPAGALLAKAERRNVPGEAQMLVEQAFADGRLPKARPGRADNFAWPPP